MKSVKTALFTAFLALTSASLAAAESAESAAPARSQLADFNLKDYVARPNWTATPSTEDIVAAYKAHADGRSGKVVMDCPILGDGHLGACNLVVESPEGQGLREAALSLTPKFQMKPVDAARKPVAGRLMRMSLDFSPQT